MNDDLLNDLARMNAYVQQLSHIMQTAQPSGSRSTGSDSTGTIEVSLDSEGMLVDIVVSEQWTHRLPAAELGAATVEAIRTADSQRHAATMTALADPRVLESLRQVDLNSITARPVDLPRRPPSRMMDGELLSADAVRELEKAIPLDAQPTAGRASVGSDVQAQVTMNAQGIVDCDVWVAWGQPVSGTAIARAIQQAYNDVRRADSDRAASNTPGLSELIEATLGELTAIQNETSGGIR